MEDLVKYILLGLLILPFVALLTDTLRITKGVMLITVIGVTGLSAILAFMMGGLHQRPNVANIYGWAFIAWPFLLLLAKGINRTISWGTIWMSVPIMSWYLVNLMMQFWYPTDGGGGGFGMGLGFIAGWLYMMIPFAVLSALFVVVQILIKQIKGEQAGTFDR